MQQKFVQLAAPGVRDLHPYQPGKPISELEREYGISGSVKLASNENPLGPGEAALAAIKKASQHIHLYPDGNGFYLKQALAKKHQVPVEAITLGNGSNEVIMLAAETFLTSQHEAIYSQHGFAAYPIAVQAVGATARVVPALGLDHPMRRGDDLNGFADRVTADTRLIFIANPNNPTGTWLEAQRLKDFVASMPAHVIVIIDQAYFEYNDGAVYGDASLWISEYPNLIVARSFSKAYGLAGLRIGYCLSHPDVASLMNRVRLAFNTNELAQAAALAALGAHDYLEKARQINAAGLTRFTDFCDAHKISYCPSMGNFLLIDVQGDALPVYERLLRKGIIVRPVGGYGLPESLRISIGLPEEMDRLMSALPEVLELG
ncbi:MAG: histidinol-phosphate transaminase [Gammaproteobacteria bacterium]|nr:histidinol-phosphate transaminase [Gammaproteobacteria bacterium]